MKSLTPRWRFLALHGTLILLLAAVFSSVDARTPVAQAATTGSSFTRDISSAGTTSFAAAASGADGIAWPEFSGTETAQGAPPYTGSIIDRSHSRGTGHGSSDNGRGKAPSNPQVTFSFDGLNHRQQRLANGGNQFSIEPPDQGLCVGNGFVMESLNDVLQVYSTAGTPLLNGGAAVDLNTFYGYSPAINRSTGVQGPFVTDPSCYFDQPTQRWFQVVLTLDTLADGTDTGTNHLDLAVSQTADPTGLWTIYRLPVQDNGTDGTPDHHCSLGFCFGDYPHIGADANGFYITTNEYSFFGPEFKAAQIYAISKEALASRVANVAVTQIDTTGLVNGNPGFTVWPATAPGNAYERSAGGTEYFASSDAAAEANGTGISSDLVVWGLSNTSSLNSATPALSLTNTILKVNPYATPPKSDQKPGPFPLGQCLNDSTIVTPNGTGCWRYFLASGGPFNEVESSLDSNDTRIQQVTFADGKLWTALDTALTIHGVNKAGIEWFVAQPYELHSGVQARIALQGYLGLANNNLTYPAVGVNSSGRGVIAFTVVGANHYPSPGYAAIDDNVGVGEANAVHVIVEGAGPADGFTSYAAFVGSPPRTRWGDYGAAVPYGNSIWIASEYVGPGNGSSCTLTEYVNTNFTCNLTRTSLGNWSTRISKLTL
jgi:hypothetical protein